MALKIAIVAHGFIPQYRVPLYELLNQRSNVSYVVFHGGVPSDLGTRAAAGPFKFPTQPVTLHEIQLGKWVIIYQPVVKAILFGGYDAVVVGHEIRFISNVILALLCKLRGIAVLYWGFGYHYDIERGSDVPERRKGFREAAVGAFKRALTRLSDGYLAYTRPGAERLAAAGYPSERIYVLQNTIDVTEQIALHRALEAVDPAAIRSAYGLRPDSVVLVFVGRLIAMKRVDLLIEAVRKINGASRQFVETIIVGAGPAEDDLKTLASDVPGVRFVGELPPGEEIARYLKVASALVIPGNVGLAAVHAFAHGRPVITRKHHMHGPEVNYITHGVNGLIVEGGPDDFAEALTRFVESRGCQKQLADAALVARDEFRIERMADRFDRAVRETIGRGRSVQIALRSRPQSWER